ncbi:MAG: peptide chain release factor N(5)-glutamine methyltransferase [Ahrensia sp.]
MASTPLLQAETLEPLYHEVASQLSNSGKDNADLDATILLEHATGHGALTRLTKPDTAITERQKTVLAHAVARRLRGEPVHRIVGSREFYGMPLSLNQATLVPRPDTEILVDLVLPWVKQRCQDTGRCSILDLGTGSGAIALALINEVRQATAVGVDISPDALRAANANAQALDLADRFSTIQSDWFTVIRGTFDLIVSNPPYITQAELADLDIEVRDHDPILALDGGVDGLNAYGIIAARGLSFLASDGLLAVEIGHTQRMQVTAFFEASGFKLLNTMADYGGRDRALSFTR